MNKKTKKWIAKTLISTGSISAVVAPVIASVSYQSNTTASNTATTAQINFVEQNIPGHEKIKLFYTPVAGYQALAVDGTSTDNFSITDKDGKAKANKFLLNGDQIVISQSTKNADGTTKIVKNNYPITGLNNFTFIPAALLAMPQKFDAGKFISDNETTYAFSYNTTPEGVKYSTVTATSKVTGYIVTPILSKFSYIEAPVKMFKAGSISTAPGYNINVGFDSSWSHPKYGTAGSQIDANFAYAKTDAELKQPLSNFVAPTTINKISIAEPFEDSGNFPFQYQQRQIKKYTLTVKDKAGNVVRTLDVPNAGNATNTLVNNLPSGGVGATIANAFEFVADVALTLVPGIGEFKTLADVGYALGRIAIDLALTKGIPATVDLIAAGFNHTSAGAIALAFGYTPKNTTESEQMINNISSVVGNAIGMGKSLKGLLDAKTFTELIGESATYMGDLKEMDSKLGELTDSNSNDASQKQEVAKALSAFSGTAPDKVAFWKNYETFLANNAADLNKIGDYGVTINLPSGGVEIPRDGSLTVDAVGLNNVGAAFHTTLFHWWSHSWGTFRTSDNAQVLIEGTANDLVFNAPN